MEEIKKILEKGIKESGEISDEDLEAGLKCLTSLSDSDRTHVKSLYSGFKKTDVLLKVYNEIIDEYNKKNHLKTKISLDNLIAVIVDKEKIGLSLYKRNILKEFILKAIYVSKDPNCQPHKGKMQMDAYLQKAGLKGSLV